MMENGNCSDENEQAMGSGTRSLLALTSGALAAGMIQQSPDNTESPHCQLLPRDGWTISTGRGDEKHTALVRFVVPVCGASSSSLFLRVLLLTNVRWVYCSMLFFPLFLLLLFFSFFVNMK
jgi:hypothetical protein